MSTHEDDETFEDTIENARKITEELNGAPATMKITVAGYNLANAIRGTVEAMVAERIDRTLTEAVKHLIVLAAKDKIAELVETGLSKQVEEILANGWKKTNHYGEPTGDAITVSSVVREHLEGGRESYRGNKNRLEQIVAELAEKHVKEALTPALEAAKKKMQTELDLTIGKNVRLSLAEMIR